MTHDDFSGWETQALMAYVATFELFMTGSMEEDPMAARYVQRLQAARDEVLRRDRLAKGTQARVAFGPEGSERPT